MKKWFLSCVLALTAGATLAFPDRPVKIIVPNPPGGPVDVMIRVVADKLSQMWKQPVLIDNKPGASGIISMTQLVKSSPDGYTLGTVIASTLTIVPFAMDNFPVDPVKDVQPIMMLARTPFVFVVAQDSKIKTWEDFVRESAQRQTTMGTWSAGTAFHLVWEQTAERAGIKSMYVPSGDSGKTLNDLIGGRLDVALDAPSSSRGLIEGGKIRPIAITSARRFQGMPGTPTLDELGLKGYAPQPWISLMAPAGTPADRVTRIHRDITTVLRDPAVIARMETLGMLIDGGGADTVTRTIAQDRRDMEPLVRKLNIRLQ